MPISNPVQIFINGSEREYFTYEGGSTLYHFSPNDCYLSTGMDFNIMFPANSEEHALDVLKRLFDFLVEKQSQYLRYRTSRNMTDAELDDYADYDLKRFKKYQQGLKDGKVKVSLAPTNQVFVVGWASHDNV